MTLDLANYEQQATEAVRTFWENRENSAQKQSLMGKVDRGERAGVTSGKNMDGFIAMLIDIVRANGLADGQIYQQRSMLTLPGYLTFGSHFANTILVLVMCWCNKNKRSFCEIKNKLVYC
jgi:Restriction endonuclease XhoI